VCHLAVEEHYTFHVTFYLALTTSTMRILRASRYTHGPLILQLLGRLPHGSPRCSWFTIAVKWLRA
jgi:hypothetical protein